MEQNKRKTAAKGELQLERFLGESLSEGESDGKKKARKRQKRERRL